MVYGGYLYCLLGFNETSQLDTSFYAQVNDSGIGLWNEGQTFPNASYTMSCPSFNGFVYCIGTASGGFTNQTYFAYLPALVKNYTPSTTVQPTTLIQPTTIGTNVTTTAYATTTINGGPGAASSGNLVLQFIIIALIAIAIYVLIRIRSKTTEKA